MSVNTIMARRSLRRFRRADVIEGLAWFSTVVVIALFIADGGISYFTNPAELVLGLGIVAGLLGSNSVLIGLILVARIPLLDATFGTDRTLAAHRWLGKPALYLLLAHAVLVVIGYGIALGVNPLTQGITMLTSLADIPLALVALVLFVTVVVVSFTIVRRRLRYESWYLVHLLTYGAVLLALPHQFSQGGLFAEGTAARAYWLTAWIAAFAALVAFRIVMPAARNARHRLRVTSVVHEGPGVVSITMTGRHLEALHALGGQFFQWRFNTPGLRWEGHPYSLSAAPDGRSLRITTRDLGDDSKRLLSLEVGTKVYFEGPYGLFTTASRTSPDVVLIGAGIGITPIRAMMQSMISTAESVTVILRANVEGQLYLREEFTVVQPNTRVRVVEVVGPPPQDGPPNWLPQAPGQSDSLAQLVPNIRDADVYICGPALWASLAIHDARSAGVPRNHIHTERFNW